jgi:hypothetical protein
VPAYVAADDEFRTALVATARSSALLLLTQLLAMTAQPQRIDVLETQSLGVRQKLFANRAATNREVLAGLSVGDIPRAMTAWEEVASALTRNRGVHAPIKLLATSTASAGRAEPG